MSTPEVYVRSQPSCEKPRRKVRLCRRTLRMPRIFSATGGDDVPVAGGQEDEAFPENKYAQPPFPSSDA